MDDNTDEEPMTPGTTNQDPGPTNQDPGPTNQDPGPTNQDPGPTNQEDSEPANEEDPPSATTPSTLVDSPSSTLEPSGLSLDNMSDLVLINIGSNLQGIDFVNFTESSPRIFSVFEDRDLDIWKRRLQVEGIGINLTIKAAADELMQTGSARTSSIHRLIYSIHFRTLDNMKRGVYKKCSVNVNPIRWHSNDPKIRLIAYDLINQTAKDSGLDFKRKNSYGIETQLVATGSSALIPFYENPIRWVLVEIQDEKATILWEKSGPHLSSAFKTTNCVTVIGTYDQFNVGNVEINGYDFRTGDEVFNFTLIDNRLHEWGVMQYRATTDGLKDVDNGNWVVFSSKNIETNVAAITAIDTENKSLKHLPMPNPEIRLDICLICQDHLCSSNNSKVFVWNLASGQLTKEISLSTVINFNKISYFNPDMNQCIIESIGNDESQPLTYIKIDGESQTVHTMPHLNGNIAAFGFSHMVRCISNNGRLQVWPSSNPDQIITIPGFNYAYRTLVTPTLATSINDDEMSFLDFLDIDNYRKKN